MRWQDIPGWFPEPNAEALDNIIKIHNVRSVIEIGTFLGRSAAFFAERCERVYCVDPFTMWDEGRHNGDAMRAGEHFYDKFHDNMVACDVWNRIYPIVMSSVDAAEEWDNLNVDMVYIDGSHDYESVKRDIDMWDNRAKKVICGDDFDENWPGVMRAVKESYPTHLLFNNVWVAVK